MPYNDAGDPTVTYSASASTGWKEILPNGSDAGYTFVEPGTSGTVRIKYVNPNLVWTTDEVDSSELTGTTRVAYMNNQVVYDSNSGIAPSILQEFGLLPVPGQPLNNLIIYAVASGIRVFEWSKCANAGSTPFGALQLNMYSVGGGTKRLYGGRPRARFGTPTPLS